MFVGYNTLIKYSASFVGSQFQIHTGSNKFCPYENLGPATVDPIKILGRVYVLNNFKKHTFLETTLKSMFLKIFGYILRTK